MTVTEERTHTATKYSFVHVATVQKEEPALWAEIERARLQVARTVPNIAAPESLHAWVLFRGEVPVGTLRASPFWSLGEAFCEVGIRIWKPSKGTLYHGREWLHWLLLSNSYVKARVFPSNKNVKALAQHYGFRLVGYDRDLDGRLLEVYALRRGELMPEKPRPLLAE